MHVGGEISEENIDRMRLHESIQSINESISRVLQGFLPHLQ
jgi:hypothetical protein